MKTEGTNILLLQMYAFWSIYAYMKHLKPRLHYTRRDGMRRD